jgi:site-specific recombinase XerC
MTRDLALAGITQAYAPHSLRHPFATQLRTAGASLEVLHALMGQRSRDGTRRSPQRDDRTHRAPYDQARAPVALRPG